MVFCNAFWHGDVAAATQHDTIGFFNKKLLISFMVTKCFLSVIWIVYVYAVKTGHVASAAFGYFIDPICKVLLRIIILHERLGRWAQLATCCVIIGVVVKSFLIASLPWVA